MARLSDVCSYEKEQDIHSSLPYVGLENIESGTGRFIGSTNTISVKSATFHFSPEHVLYGRLRPYLNKVFLPYFEGHCSTEIFPIRPGPKISREFLFHWLSMDATVKAIDATSTGARMPRANMSAVLDFELPVPPLPEQHRIVAILDEAFEAIATAKANTENNLRNARDFREAERDRLIASLAAEAARRKLGEVCGFIRGPFGGSLKKSMFAPDGFAIYEQRHAIYDQFDDVRYFVDEDKFRSMKRFELRPGDLIMSCSGTMGRVAIAPSSLKRGIINQALLKMTPSSNVTPEYLKHWMESRDFQEQLKSLSGGAAIQNVASVSILKGISMPLPSLEAQRSAVHLLASLDDGNRRLQEIIKRKLAVLDELKESLLHQAFTGALTAKPTDQHLDAVA